MVTTAMHACTTLTLCCHKLGPPKPQLSLWDGIVMGGGVGLSPCTAARTLPHRHGEHNVCHARNRHRLFSGCRCQLRAVSTAARNRGVLGPHRAAAQGCRCTGLRPRNALRQVASAAGLRRLCCLRWPQRRRLRQRQRCTAALDWQKIERCFCKQTVEEMVAAVQAEGGEWGEKTAKTVSQKSRRSDRQLSHPKP